jgi:hypothetical protein
MGEAEKAVTFGILVFIGFGIWAIHSGLIKAVKLLEEIRDNLSRR